MASSRGVPHTHGEHDHQHPHDEREPASPAHGHPHPHDTDGHDPHTHGPDAPSGGQHPPEAHLHDEHEQGHAHTHGAVDPSLFSTERGIRALKWSFAGLAVTAALQLAVAIPSGSVALLADTIHNLGDAATALPLWIAFKLGRMQPTPRFTYGYGRAEDLAGVVIILVILLSAMIAAYESIDRLLHPQPVQYLGAVIAAALVGFAGNEAVAWYRIKVGREIGSAALEADGYHARIDGLTSLAVLVGAIGVALGFPLADPLVGLIITVLILRVVWDAAKNVLGRLLDGVDPEVVPEIREVLAGIPGVMEVSDVRVRWLGHRMVAEVNLAVDAQLTVEQAHEIAQEAHHQLLHRLHYLSHAVIHIDPTDASGEEHHRIAQHEHGEYSSHGH